MRMRPPAWLPWLGPPLAGLGAGLAGIWLQVGFWGALAAALVVGFAPIVGYGVWKWLNQRRG